MEFSDNIEYAVHETESRGNAVKEMRQMLARCKQKGKEYRSAGYEIVYSERRGNQDIFMLLDKDGNYSVRVNNKLVIQDNTRAGCAKQAYLKGYITSKTGVEISEGRTGADRRAALKRLKNAIAATSKH